MDDSQNSRVYAISPREVEGERPQTTFAPNSQRVLELAFEVKVAELRLQSTRDTLLGIIVSLCFSSCIVAFFYDPVKCSTLWLFLGPFIVAILLRLGVPIATTQTPPK